MGTIEAQPSNAFPYKDAVIYQLHVKAFADSNADGIGDFRGLISRLPYIAALGATAIWLLPFYPSPLRDDGYDISDYTGVHPSYGTLADVRDFIAAAHGLGLRIITELVINHTSDQHPWFIRARNAPPESDERNFYVWSDTPDKYAATRVIFTDTETSNWTWDAVAKQWFWHRFFSHQPDLNFDHPPVFDAVVDAMRFWFHAGVDGMRLDAVPYLCEREGTSNENLPETHAILKRLRAVVDAEFPDRFLLAEANQWPEDVSAYFGEGDECHMAFHFPLMPRMFMSIAAEDRYPLYDIMRQTPSIPENAQWAIFLRNHDELTLEMVTDRERAFLYSTYAPDVRARLNVGIRRRLAPLLENDRRKIELMTSLLLSMPGTPILYYGDEIGMGDNIYLGDRDGVRTPMQWSDDRNAGFSRADVQRLYLPVIMDSVYGYAAVNVEAQERNPSSLLHGVRALVATRQAHQTFGRGSVTFLYPDNRRVAAYLREFDGEVILCVANLSHLAQPVSLDLSRFLDRVPVELLGWSAFPPIVDDRYAFTLAPYAFFWFSLMPAERAPTAPHAPATQLPELATLVLPFGRASILDGPANALIEREIIPRAIAARRWLDMPPNAPVALVDVVDIDATADTPLLALARVGEPSFGNATVIPWQFSGGDPSAETQRAAFARTRTGPREGLLYDAGIDDALWEGLVAALRTSAQLVGRHGALHAQATFNVDALPFDNVAIRRTPSGDRRLAAVVGETMLLVLFRHTVIGRHPTLELLEYLHAAHFSHMPPLLGTLRYHGNNGATLGVGLARRFILARGNANDVLRDALDRRGPATDLAPTFSLIAQRLAELHAVLAHAGGNAAFTPEMTEHGIAIRIHGDFDITRVVLTETDALVLDPGLDDFSTTLEQRFAKRSPIDDAMTFVRSMQALGSAVVGEAAQNPSVDEGAAGGYVDEFIQLLTTEFIEAYLAHAQTSGLAIAPFMRAALRNTIRV